MSKGIYTVRRCQWPNLPPREITTHHPPRLVCVLLNTATVAKIADLGVARIVPHVRAAATMTKGPGNIIYMPPEALENKPGDENLPFEEQNKKSKYDVSIDVFSFGDV